MAGGFEHLYGGRTIVLAGNSLSLRKARGAYFTPPSLAEHVASWAIRTQHDRILEPSCGEAAFLMAAGSRLRQLEAAPPVAGAAPDLSPTARHALSGFELHGESAALARARLKAAGVTADVRVADFLAQDPAPAYDVVVGNPPYVRYQAYTGAWRERGRQAASAAGVSLSGLASSWAAFTIHAALFLAPGGRLGLVLPAELLSVNYAAPIRSFLLRRFRKVELVLFDERVFPDVQEEVVLLLAEGEGPTDRCEVRKVRNVSELSSCSSATSAWQPLSGEDKWTPALLPASVVGTTTDLLRSGSFAHLKGWGETTLGMVTGSNRYFALPADRCRELGLAPADLIPLSPPGSSHLRRLSFSHAMWVGMSEAGAPCFLFRPLAASGSSARYIREGERNGIDSAYKCRMRQPWWRVPLVPPADLLLTYMNADTPRLCTNLAGVHHLNSVHGLYLRPELGRLGKDLLPIASLNTVTLLGAETIGRAYGGGLLKLEPKEADQLPVPAPGLVRPCAQSLRRLRPRLESLLLRGRLLDAVALVDGVILVERLGLDHRQIKTLTAARSLLAQRRLMRASPARRGLEAVPALAS